jgi:RNA-binding protein Musashi
VNLEEPSIQNKQVMGGDEEVYNDEQDIDDDIEFNLGNGNGGGSGNGNGYDVSASHEAHGPGIKEDG